MIQRAPKLLPVPATNHILRKAGNSVRRLTDLFDGLKEINSGRQLEDLMSQTN